MINDDKRAEQAKAIRDVLRSFAENLPFEQDLAALRAKTIRLKFNALRKEGFTETQALFLCLEVPRP